MRRPQIKSALQTVSFPSGVALTSHYQRCRVEQTHVESMGAGWAGLRRHPHQVRMRCPMATHNTVHDTPADGEPRGLLQLLLEFQPVYPVYGEDGRCVNPPSGRLVPQPHPFCPRPHVPEPQPPHPCKWRSPNPRAD